MERHQGRGRGAELSHAHRPDHFKSACYGPDLCTLNIEFSGNFPGRAYALRSPSWHTAHIIY